MDGRMKAVLLTRHGGPDALEYREDVPIPQPAPGEVLVCVGAAGMNNTDIWTRVGAYGRAQDSDADSGWLGAFTFPRIQGGDIAGRIVEVGPGVDSRRMGERVLVDPTLYADDGAGIRGVIGSEVDGGFAQYVVVPSGNAHVIRTPLTDPQLATFPIAYVTAERMLNQARLRGGEAIVITGASGGAGSALVQLAARRGSRVAALTSSAHIGEVRALGASVALDREAGDWPDALAEALGGQPVDVVADVVGGSLFPGLLAVLRPGGRYVTAGAIAGPVVELDLRTLYLQRLELIGSTMGTRREFADLVRYIEEGGIRPLLARTYALQDLRRAQEDFLAKGFFGKLAIVP